MALLETKDPKQSVCLCPVEVTLAVIGGKYKPLLLYYLQQDGILRFGQLRRIVKNASKKMLTQQLRELERDGLVRRKVYQQVPPKVEYSLTQRGHSLESVLTAMGLWGKRNAKAYNIKIAPKPQPLNAPKARSE